jgi:hypothetical protein
MRLSRHWWTTSKSRRRRGRDASTWNGVRMNAFVAMLMVMVMLKSLLDVPPARQGIYPLEKAHIAPVV